MALVLFVGSKCDYYSLNLTSDSQMLTLFPVQFRRVPLPGDAYTEAEPLDLGLLPRDLDVARNCPEVAIVPVEKSVLLLRHGAIASSIDVDYVASAAALSPDGDEAVVGGRNGKLYVYSVKGDTLTQEAVLEKHRGEVSAVRYSPDGSMVASGDLNREAVVWDRVSREVSFLSSCAVISFDGLVSLFLGHRI